MKTPRLIQFDSHFQLEVDGEPTILLGGQVHNSSTSTVAAIESSFAKVAQLNFNFVIAPISWAQFEASEGEFDFTLVEQIIRVAKVHSLRVALIWFGAFKNAKSTYAPSWVRADRARFPRALTSDGAPEAKDPTLSVFSEELLQADKRAFTQLLAHLEQNDPDHQVVMVPIENEVGLLKASRDYSAQANLAWELRGKADSWQEHERFMAQRFATYCNDLALAGKAKKNLPMFVNAWLGPQPGQDRAGQWPSGGPSALVLDTWKEFAPDIDILCPDIYVHEAIETMEIYHRDDNPLFIPESRHIVGNLLWALGHHGAIGYSVFGAEDGRIGNQISRLYELLNGCKKKVALAQAQQRTRALLITDEKDLASAKFGDLAITAADNLALVRRFVEVAGVDLLVKSYEPDSELEDLLVVIDSPGDSRPVALVIQESETTFFMVGRGINLDFAEPGFKIEIDSVERGHFENETWVVDRVLNGDERMNFLPLEDFSWSRVEILKFRTQQ
jgi:hypothetical protein